MVKVEVLITKSHDCLKAWCFDEDDERDRRSVATLNVVVIDACVRKTEKQNRKLKPMA
jgi:hypothetical protein